jgi:transposase
MLTRKISRNWIKKNNNNEDVEIVGRKEDSGRPAGRPPTLTDVHKDYLVEILDEKLGLGLDEMMESLNSHFIDLSISKSASHKFITTKCDMSLKRVHLHSVVSNHPETIEERYQ